MCSWDRQFTHLVRDAPPESHHSYLIHEMYCSYRIRFQKGQWLLYVPMLWICGNTSSILSRRRIFDVTANSSLWVMIISIAVKLAFWILSSSVPTILPISLSNLSVKHFSNVWIFTVSSLVIGVLASLITVNSWSTGPLSNRTFCLSIFEASPMISSWSESSN